jgi:hypothetical protein
VPAKVPQEARAFVIGIASRLAKEVFQEQRHPGEGTGRNNAARLLESAIEERRNDRVDPGVQLFDPGDGGLDQLG